MVQPARQSAAAHQNDDSELLWDLMTAPPPKRAELKPAALRSQLQLEDHALGGFLRRTWVDRLLLYTEWLLVIGAVSFFLFWLFNGPIRDWWHLAQTQQAATAGSSMVLPTPALTELAPLPFTAPPGPADTTEEFLAPRLAAAVPINPKAPQPNRLLMPSIGVDSPVKEVFVVNGAWEVADYAAGYMHGTALPGEPGNTALAGHAGIRGAVFRDIGKLQPGDDLFVDAGGWRYQYKVNRQFTVWPTQVEVLNPTSTPTLTLITCVNWDTQRLIVVADLVASKPLPSN